jgi:hypothetical protein
MSNRDQSQRGGCTRRMYEADDHVEQLNIKSPESELIGILPVWSWFVWSWFKDGSKIVRRYFNDSSKTLKNSSVSCSAIMFRVSSSSYDSLPHPSFLYDTYHVSVSTIHDTVSVFSKNATAFISRKTPPTPFFS